MATKMIDSLRSGDEFIGWAKSHGASVRSGKGSHFIISTDQGSAVVPVHPGDLGKGLRCKIKKMFVLIGLALIPLTCLISAIFS